jgi:hypothetical protein
MLWTGDSLQTRPIWVFEAVLFYNCNTLPSIPVGHSVHNKESYENVNILMDANSYDKSNGKSVVT